MSIESSMPRRAASQVERGLRITVLIGQTAGCCIALVKMIGGGPSGYPTWFTWTTLGLLLTTTLATYALPPPRRRTALQAFVLICATAMAAQIWVWNPASTPFTVPPLDNALGIGMGLAALAFSWQIATSIIAIYAASYLIILPHTTSPLDTFGIISVTVLAGAACVAASYTIEHAMNDLTRVEDQLQATTDLRETLHRRSMALVKWRDVLHGKVIGSLLAAQQPPPTKDDQQVQALAQAALAALAGIGPPAAPIGDTLNQLAASSHLNITATIEGDWSFDGPVDAFRSAVTEALANVSRHSGQRHATVTARFTTERWEVTISDPGVGFDPHTTEASRGLHVSLINPITSSGGTCTIHSHPEHGTTVSFEWEPLSRLAAATTPTGTRWLVVVAYASLIVHFVIGWQLQQLTDRPMLVVAGGTAMLILLTLAVTGVNPAMLGVAMIGVQIMLAANVHLPVHDLWVFWFAGALCGFNGVLAYRGRIGWSATVVALSWLSAAIALSVRSSQPLGTLSFELVGFYAGPLASTVFGIIGWIITLSQQALQRQAEEREAALRETEQVNRSTKLWLLEHGALITRVTPLLEQLAHATTTSPLLLEDCRVTEAACRDHLEVPNLVTPAVAAAVEQARRRGVTVKFGTQTELDTTHPSLHTQRALLLTALEVPSLRSLILTPATDGISLLIRADQADIPVETLGSLAPLVEVVPLADGMLTRFQLPTTDHLPA